MEVIRKLINFDNQIDNYALFEDKINGYLTVNLAQIELNTESVIERLVDEYKNKEILVLYIYEVTNGHNLWGCVASDELLDFIETNHNNY